MGARTAEERGLMYMPLGKLARFNNKSYNFLKSAPVDVINESDFEKWTLATTVSGGSTEIDNPMARRIIIDRTNTHYQNAVRGFKYWPAEPYKCKSAVCKKTCNDFSYKRY